MTENELSTILSALKDAKNRYRDIIENKYLYLDKPVPSDIQKEFDSIADLYDKLI